MSTIMSNIYSGQLHPKRKAELEEIASRMAGLSLPVGYVKFDVEESIREHLRRHRAVREDPAFAGLWDAMAESSVDSDGSDLTDLEDDDDLPAPVASTSSAVKLGQHVLQPASLGRRSPSTRLSARRSLGSASAGSPVATKANQVRSLRSSKSLLELRKVAVKATEETIKVVGEAQATLSQAWTITAATVVVELAYLSWTAVPWKHTTFGPHHWLTRDTTSAFAIPLPSLKVLGHSTFTSPLLSWVLLSVALPLVLSLFVAFPALERRRGVVVVAPPNAVTFNVFRLALGVLVHYIFAGKPNAVQWSFEHVEGYPAVQILGAGVAGLLSAYQDVAGR